MSKVPDFFYLASLYKFNKNRLDLNGSLRQKENEVNDARQKNENFQTNLERVQSELDDLIKKARRRQNEKLGFQKQLEENNKIFEECEIIQHKKQEEMKEFQHKKDELSNEQNKIAKDNKELEDIYKSNTIQNQSLLHDIEKITLEINSENQKKQRFIEINSKNKKDAVVKESQCQELMKEIEPKKEMKSKLLDDIRLIQEKLKEETEKLNEPKLQLSRLSNEFTKINNEKKNLGIDEESIKSDFSSETNKNATLTREYQNISNQNKSVLNSIEKTENDHKNHQKNVKGTKNKIDSIQDEINYYEQMIAKKEADLAKLNKAIDSLNQDRAQVLSKMQEKKEENK